ncbi:MAG: HEAT repeat domain-containing protein [Treponema sp.]|nr:HEAT repeat domain-containing protein [Treponema sp.]
MKYEKSKIKQPEFNRAVQKFCVTMWLLFFLLLIVPAYSQQNIEASRLATLKYGTETELASLIQSLRNENADYLDGELIILAGATRNQQILSGVFGFFSAREKSGLEERAIRAIEGRDDEANETVLSAVDYLGRVKAGNAIHVIMELLDNGERRFMNNAFRALGRAGSASSELADETADYLADYYNYRDPGDENRSEVINAMGATGSANAVPLLTEIASNTDARFPLRIAAMNALSQIGDPRGLEAILSCVNTNDPNVRAAAVAALGPFSGDEVDKAILDGFRDSNYRTRIASAQASRARILVDAIPYLQFRAERDDTPNVKDEAIRALGEIAAATANDEAAQIIYGLFSERRNAERVRLISAEMLMKISAGNYFSKLIEELDDSKRRNQTNLYNGFLKIVSEAKIEGDTAEMESLTRRFLQNGSVLEKLYGLEMAANNNLSSLSAEVKVLLNDRNESIARRARQTAERLGIETENS